MRIPGFRVIWARKSEYLTGTIQAVDPPGSSNKSMPANLFKKWGGLYGIADFCAFTHGIHNQSRFFGTADVIDLRDKALQGIAQA